MANPLKTQGIKIDPCCLELWQALMVRIFFSRGCDVCSRGVVWCRLRFKNMTSMEGGGLMVDS